MIEKSKSLWYDLFLPKLILGSPIKLKLKNYLNSMYFSCQFHKIQDIGYGYYQYYYSETLRQVQCSSSVICLIPPLLPWLGSRTGPSWEVIMITVHYGKLGGIRQTFILGAKISAVLWMFLAFLSRLYTLSFNFHCFVSNQEY